MRVPSFVCVRFVAIVVLLVSIMGVSVTAAEQGITFASEGMRLTAYFTDEQVRIVISDGREYVLPQVIAASGAKYESGAVVFWNKGDTASFDLDGLSYMVRAIDPDSDPWERARRVGARFRAIGQEPGWHLEIRDDGRFHLTLGYGDTHIVTPYSILEINYATRTRTFRALLPASPVELTVIVQERTCYDVMSGEGFTSTVTVELPASGLVFSGCGRDL